jgi:hypothetical protein
MELTYNLKIPSRRQTPTRPKGGSPRPGRQAAHPNPAGKRRSPTRPAGWVRLILLLCRAGPYGKWYPWTSLCFSWTRHARPFYALWAGGLRPSSTPSDTPRRTGLMTRMGMATHTVQKLQFLRENNVAPMKTSFVL